MKVKAWPLNDHRIVDKIVNGVSIKVFADRPLSLGALIENSASRFPEKEALIYQSKRISYRDLKETVDRVSVSLQHVCGIGKGDRVAVLFTNTLEFCVCYFAITQTGAVCQPVNYRLTADEMEYQLKDTGAKVIILEEKYLKTIKGILSRLPEVNAVFVSGDSYPDEFENYKELDRSRSENLIETAIDEEDLASIVYTSGTTGRPKGTMISHRNLICNSISFSSISGLDSSTKQIILTPLFHASALHSQLITGILMGATSVIMKEFKTKDSMALMADEKINLVVAVPTMYWFWVNDPDFENYDLSSIRCTLSGAAPAAPELIKILAEKFPKSNFINAGGQTESTSCTFALPPEDALRKAGSVGWATPPNEIKVVDTRDEECDFDETGELWFKGPAIARGYWNNPNGTKETFIDGWVRTGDIGKVDKEGYLHLLDRKKDMIIRGGENIYCVEVENILYSHPKVLEAAVVGVPDKVFGEQVKAVLVMKPGKEGTEEEIRQFCREKLADYKVPKYVDFRMELPRNPGGKVVKSLLKGEQG